jgi:uncharacterized membrane protein YgaE (UPF0421/DUF939 family)
LSWFRFFGTAIGAIAGLMGILSMGKTPWAVGIAVFSTTLLCYSLNLRESYRLAGATSVIVILASHLNPAGFAFQRFIDVTIGILIALLVSLLVFPRKTLTKG